jgi:hypothetical protein
MVDGAEINLRVRRPQSFERREKRVVRVAEGRQMQEIDAAPGGRNRRVQQHDGAARSSTPAVTSGIGCSAKPDAFDPCVPIPGSNGSAANQVGIRAFSHALGHEPALLSVRANGRCRFESRLSETVPAFHFRPLVCQCAGRGDGLPALPSANGRRFFSSSTAGALAATPAHAGAGHGRQSADKRVRSLGVRAHATPCGPDGLSGGAASGWERRPDLRLKVNDAKVRRQF